MDITTLAAWGEFIGGIAVVVSLVYLASQIRQNSKLLMHSTAATMGEADIAVNSLLLGDAELLRIVREGMVHPSSLSTVELDRFGVSMDMMMRAFLRSFVFARGSGVDAALWQTEERSYASVVQSIGFQPWWTDNRSLFSDEFADYVDGLIREGKAAG